VPCTKKKWKKVRHKVLFNKNYSGYVISETVQCYTVVQKLETFLSCVPEKPSSVIEQLVNISSKVLLSVIIDKRLG
jgi:hypothetical protein